MHLLWALWMFLYLVHFWWWEFRLHAVPSWDFNLYLFVVIYALLLYLACALIFPEQLDDYAGYRDYFYSRRAWFFGTIAAIYAIDYADTWIKGSAYLHSFGIEYPIRNATYIVLAIIAMCTRRAWFHGSFVVVGLIGLMDRAGVRAAPGACRTLAGRSANPPERSLFLPILGP